MREVRATFNKSANHGTRHIFVVSAVLFIVLVIFATNVPYSHGAQLSSALRDDCNHTMQSPTSFFSQYFDTTFLKNVFKNLITSAPSIKMQFFLYKSDFAECGREIITHDSTSLEMSEFNSEHPTRILIHGWMSHSKGTSSRLIKEAYLSLVKRVPHVNVTSTNTPSDFNVIICDWSLIAANLNYFGVVDMVEDLGRLLAEFVNFLHLRAGLHYNDVYLIGHSLGAQIAGSAGKQAHPFRFNTIFATDPAGPKFRDQPPEYRIDASDAEYVESIETSSNFGFEKPVGHATFYPNFGQDQKKCYFVGCSHSRSYQYFAESITSGLGFLGVPCRRSSNNTWICTDTDSEFRMGGEPSAPKNGTFYLRTADGPPYALGKDGKDLR